MNNLKFIFALALTFAASTVLFAQNRSFLGRNPLGTESDEGASAVKMKLVARTQSFNSDDLLKHDHYDQAINSPKSVIFSSDGMKYYVNSLEGYTTHVFETQTHKKLSDIKHKFDADDKKLFLNNEYTVFDYEQKEGQENYNHFSGKPVESCLSHNGKYLWVTYYRRDWDNNAQYPSALAIIDTETDKIVRVMPTGPLPKMIAASPDNKYICVTHWGDNTVAIIDIESDLPFEFKYTKHLAVGERIVLSYDENVEIDRDNDCGHCLRGTVFTENSKHLLVGRMGGAGGITVFQTSDFKSLGTVQGMKANVRHLEIVGNNLYLSSDRLGYVQKCNVDDMILSLKNSQKSIYTFKRWKSAYVGIGARTISVTKDRKYIFAAVNNEKKIVVVRSSDMKVVSKINADPYPVGMALSKYETRLMVTAQGKGGQGGGNSVTIYSIEYL
jgi:DNA-binding beta-propeller fold protein YncE